MQNDLGRFDDTDKLSISGFQALFQLIERFGDFALLEPFWCRSENYRSGRQLKFKIPGQYLEPCFPGRPGSCYWF